MMQYPLKRSCWLEINLDSVRDNFMAYKKMIGDEIKVMPAVKAGAYGHGIVACCKELEACGADYLGVGDISEAISLRDHGVKMPLLIFASNTIEEVVDLYVKYDLIPTILTLREAEAFSAAAGKLRDVFVKIDTGRGRLGVNAEEFPNFFRAITKLPNIHVEGVYSHIAGGNWPGDGPDYTTWQYERFAAAIDALGEDGKRIPFRQLANTPVGIAYPDFRMTGVCPGRAIWGFSPLSRREGHPDLTYPMVAWKSRLVHVNEVCGGKFGEKYAATKLEEPKRIGIMVGGLSDGLPEKFAKSEVLIRGKRIPVASSISLEHTILDLSGCPEAEPGDEVIIIGKQGSEEITLDQRIAEWGIGVPSIWVNIAPHVARFYYKGGTLHSVWEGEKLTVLR